MAIIDSQIHAYEANTPQRPWKSQSASPPSATGDEHVAAMDKLGVDGAIFVSSFSMYQYDSSYAVEVQKKLPGRFGIGDAAPVVESATAGEPCGHVNECGCCAG